MPRLLAEGIVLFLLPFAAYAALLLGQRRFPLVREAWDNGRLAWLTGTGLVLAITGLLALGLLTGRYHGGYVPAHIEAGQLVPGHVR